MLPPFKCWSFHLVVEFLDYVPYEDFLSLWLQKPTLVSDYCREIVCFLFRKRPSLECCHNTSPNVNPSCEEYTAAHKKPVNNAVWVTPFSIIPIRSSSVACLYYVIFHIPSSSERRNSSRIGWDAPSAFWASHSDNFADNWNRPLKYVTQSPFLIHMGCVLHELDFFYPLPKCCILLRFSLHHANLFWWDLHLITEAFFTLLLLEAERFLV